MPQYTILIGARVMLALPSSMVIVAMPPPTVVPVRTQKHPWVLVAARKVFASVSQPTQGRMYAGTPACLASGTPFTTTISVDALYFCVLDSFVWCAW